MNEFKFTVTRSNRKTLAVQIKKDGTVQVRAPYRVSDDTIRKFVESRREWILRHVSKVLERSEDRGPTFTNAEIHAMAQETASFLPALVQEYAQKLNVHPARITVRNQKTRWGSCSSKGGLNFNCLLALAPDHVRRYVVIHELCHLKEMNHSPAFWRLVSSQMPDYQKAKEWLKTDGRKLIDRLNA